PQRLSTRKSDLPDRGLALARRRSRAGRAWRDELAGAVCAGCVGAGGALGPDAWRALRRLGGQRWFPVRRRSADSELSVAHRAQVVAEGVVVVPAGRRMAGTPQRRPRRALPDGG